MEAITLTGTLNVMLRRLANGGAFSRGFVAMLSVKLLLVLLMVGAQVWMGILWKREGPLEVALRTACAGTTVQIILDAVAVVLGFGVRSV